MSSIRLFVLGTLARQGPMHGHQIRRVAQVDRTELWTDIKVGSVYAALSRMASEGAITVSRSERVGNRPERTVYEITDAGRDELAALRDEALTFSGLPAEIVDLGVQSAAALTSEELRRAFESRLTAITAASVGWQNQWDAAAPHITRREALTFAHTQLRLEAEADWCRLVLDELQAEAAEDSATKVTS